MFRNCERQCHKTVSTDHNFWWESRRAEADSNRGPSLSAYQPNSLPLGQTGSHWSRFGSVMTMHMGTATATGWVAGYCDWPKPVHGHSRASHVGASCTCRHWAQYAQGEIRVHLRALWFSTVLFYRVHRDRTAGRPPRQFRYTAPELWPDV